MRRFTIGRALAALGLAGGALAAGAGMFHFKQDTPYTPFPDVAEQAWYAGDVARACALGLMNGKDAGIFDPEGGLTLAEAATMAARARSVYEGGGFTPGGDPWYWNAVEYCVDREIFSPGAFADAGAPAGYEDAGLYLRRATRGEMAFLFAHTLPAGEYPRINRVSDLPDVEWDTPHADEIYLLYNAGILTGADAGAFRPQACVTRAEAAAILNRLALPDSRKQLSTGGSAPDALLTSPDGGVRLALPQGWTAATGADAWTLAGADGSAALVLCAARKGDARSPGDLAAYTAGMLDKFRVRAGGAVLVTVQPAQTLFRGLSGFAFSVRDGQTYCEAYCLENGAYFYTLVLARNTGEITPETLDALCAAAWSFDMAL